MNTNPVLFETITPHPEPVQIARLLDDIEAIIKRHVILSDHAAAALAVWVLHTYTFDLRDTVAYVAIESPEKRCGKTTLLSVLAAMACKPLIASNITVSALFRAIDTCHPTLFVDEADTFLAGNGVMRGIINSGNTWRTAYVVRLSAARKNSLPSQPRASAGVPFMEPPSEDSSFKTQNSTSCLSSGGALPEARCPQAVSGPQPSAISHQLTDSSFRKYSCWCPKVIAMIGKVPDTIADRSIVVPMSRKLVTEACAPLAELDASVIKSKCARFALDSAPAIRQAAKIRGDGLNDRAADTFDPLYAIARLASPQWEMKLHAAAIALAAAAQSENSGADLLLDIISVFLLSFCEKMSSRDLVNKLRNGVAGMKSFAVKYAAINEFEIAKILRSYNIRPSCIRIGSQVCKGYAGADFREALERYIPRDELHARFDELRRQAKLLDEANAEARAEAARNDAIFNQILAEAPKDRIMTQSEVIAKAQYLKANPDQIVQTPAASPFADQNFNVNVTG